MDENIDIKELQQCLDEIGCDHQMITEIIMGLNQHDYKKVDGLFLKQCGLLLESIHNKQHQIDRINAIINNLK
ncbi:hypothetical protein [uncultured Thomasclavelia sp.]|uniref:hypothetical protein n=1 Tax=uncultured Thomasclavelia sp. TaxID=3025759 RepID=UPI0025DC005B|nr:hypothetical protein [uncultured Thomasclavelia sp.]